LDFKEQLVGDLYYTKSEIEALSAVNARALDAAIERCLNVRNSYALCAFRLDACGPYVARKAHEFDMALRALAAAKASKKTESTGNIAGRKGGSLGSALRRAQEAVETQAGRERLSTCLTMSCLRSASGLTCRYWSSISGELQPTPLGCTGP